MATPLLITIISFTELLFNLYCVSIKLKGRFLINEIKIYFFEILEKMAIKHYEFIWQTLHEMSMHSGIMTHIIDRYINLGL